MEMHAYGAGVPSWVDVASPDPSRSAVFYGALFGWECPEGPPEVGGYRMCLLRGKPVAGLGLQMSPGPPRWNTYVTVGDADRTAEAAREVGGTVIAEPLDVLDFGRMAVLADPTGAVISIWQPGTHAGAQLVNEPGSWVWSELATSDVPGAIDFYGRVFGWASVTHGEGPRAFAAWEIDGRSMAGMVERPASVPADVPSMWAVSFAVTDIDVTVATVVEHGGSLVTGPVDMPQGRFAVVVDPVGAVFHVMALTGDLAG